MNVEIKEKEIRIGDNLIMFAQRIVKAVELGGKVIVLLNSDDFDEGDELVGRNIVAYGPDGHLAWRIEYHGFKVRNGKGVEVPQAFFGLWVDKDGQTLRAGIPVAVFEVDPKNGMFLKVELDR